MICLQTRVRKDISETGVRVEREISAEKVNMSHFERFDFRIDYDREKVLLPLYFCPARKVNVLCQSVFECSELNIAKKS